MERKFDELNSFANFYDTMTSQNKEVDCTVKDDIYIVSACVINNPSTNWLQESEWLQNNLRARASILESINSYTKQFSSVSEMSDLIGVHIRMGQSSETHRYEDYSSWESHQIDAIVKYRSQSNYIYFMVEMEKIWRKNTHQKFFLCADNPDIYRAFSVKYPTRMGKTILHVPKTVWDRSPEQLIGAMLDVYLLSKCNYVLGSPWSSFTELVSRLSKPLPNGKSRQILISGEHFGKQKYGLLFYPGSYNIGDDIQSLAARGFLPIVDYLVDRDNQQKEIYDLAGRPIGSMDSLSSPVVLVENGWYDGRLTKFPPHPKIKPFFISFHLNENEKLFTDPRYQVLQKEARMGQRLLDTKGGGVEYLRHYSPIGTRDEHTLRFMQANDIPAYNSSCLTLTLRPSELGIGTQPPTRKEILVVDANIDESELFHSLVPSEIISQAIFISHGLESLPGPLVKQRIALEFLERYRNAKLVITSRLHCALPCLAFGTPFLFILKRMDEDPRFDKNLKILLGNGKSLPPNWDWSDPASFVIASEKLKLAESLSSGLREKITRFMDAV